jgi:hypothetical protein
MTSWIYTNEVVMLFAACARFNEQEKLTALVELGEAMMRSPRTLGLSLIEAEGSTDSIYREVARQVESELRAAGLPLVGARLAYERVRRGLERPKHAAWSVWYPAGARRGPSTGEMHEWLQARIWPLS